MKTTKGERTFYAINYVILTLGALLCLLPFLHVASQSLSSYRANTSGLVGIWPVELNVDAYKQLFQGTRILPSLFNSVKITVIGTLLSMVFTVMAAYPLSRRHFWGRKHDSHLPEHALPGSGEHLRRAVAAEPDQSLQHDHHAQLL